MTLPGVTVTISPTNYDTFHSVRLGLDSPRFNGKARPLRCFFEPTCRLFQPRAQSGQGAEFLDCAGAAVWKRRRRHAAQRGSGTEFQSCLGAGRSAALEASRPVDSSRDLTGQLVDPQFDVLDRTAV